MRPGKLISPDEALRIVLRHARPLAARRVALAEAAGRWLAEDIRADRDQPPADRSAMDGYAVIAADLKRPPAALRLVGEVAAGSAARMRVRTGTCAAILTGGNVPPGADTVVPIEQTHREGPDVVFSQAAPRGDNIRLRGEEARRGASLLACGTRLGPAEIGVCAMAGACRPKVHRLPKVAVLVTGAEVRDVAQSVAAHQLRDSNGPALLAALARNGFADATRAIVPDDPAAIAAALKAALRRADVAIVTGGVSVGTYDFVPEAIERIGGRLRFHGVRMKPGQPQLYATLGPARHIFGLPGNPVSVLTGFAELALPALRRLAGAPKDACRPSIRLPLAEEARSKGKRAYFALARIVRMDSGPAVAMVRSAGSADIIAASRADGVIVIPMGVKRIAAGEFVEFHAWRAPW
ncbi:MAG: gephyrin-like molybdotransferase Glp [Phycisphaerae bacterium]